MQILGTTGPDTISGTPEDDDIRGLGGDDVLRGLDGDDILRGGEGRDNLIGGDGDDRFLGGLGDEDVITGGAGRDRVVFIDVAASGGVTLDLSAPGANGFAAAFIDLDGDGVSEEQDRVFVSETDDTGTEDIRGSFGDDDFRGNALDNRILGDDGDDVIRGSLGDDTISGGEGFDTADYSDLGERISLQTAGLVQKGETGGFGPDFAGDAGTDTLGGFDPEDLAGFEVLERVVGAVGERNRIDGTSRSGAVNLTVRLDEGTFESEVVEANANFPAFLIGTTFGFKIENFVDVAGTDNDDTIIGDDEDNVVFGSEGDDVLQGNGGDDVLDYSNLGGSVTINAAGLYEKFDPEGNSLGVDTVGRFQSGTVVVFDVSETVIGDEGFRNTLDGSNVTPGFPGGADASITADLRVGRIDANATNPDGSIIGPVFGFDVVNFVDVLGSENDDLVFGDGEDNFLSGFGGDDVIRAGAGDDIVRAAGGDDTLRGGAGDDTLSGGGGDDVIRGDDGDDSIEAGAGDDRVFGGAGADVFQFNIAAGARSDAEVDGRETRVSDFSGEDSVQFFRTGIFSAQEVLDAAGGVIPTADGDVGVVSVAGSSRLQLRLDIDGGGSFDGDETFAVLGLEPDLLTV